MNTSKSLVFGQIVPLFVGELLRRIRTATAEFSLSCRVLWLVWLEWGATFNQARVCCEMKDPGLQFFSNPSLLAERE